MDANTDPREMTFVAKLVSKSDVRKKLWDTHRWNEYDIVREPGLQNAVMFLTRDAGIEDALEPFRVYVQTRAGELLVRFTANGYAEAAEYAAKAVYEAEVAKKHWIPLTGAVQQLRLAIAHGSCAALKAALGHFDDCPHNMQLHEDYEIAEKLIETLREARLI